MADDLSQLGVSWVEESVLRDDVVAAVDARVDAADEAELRRRWEALEEMERVVAELQSSAARLHKGSAAVGVEVLRAGSGGDGERRAEENTAAVLQFRLAKAQREVESRAKLLRRWQLEMEARQRKREMEAKKRIQGTTPAAGAAASSGNPSVAHAGTNNNNNNNSGCGSSVAPMSSSPPGVKLPFSLASLTSAFTSPLRGGDATTTTTTNNSVKRGRKCPLRANELPVCAAMAGHSGAASELKRSPSGGSNNSNNNNNNNNNNASMLEYSGGAILPSLYRVTLTRSDVRSKSRKYTDDGDLDAFNARQQKRKRLEEVAASITALQTNASPSGTVKLEAGRDAMASSMLRVKQERNIEEEEQQTGASRMEAIDVDALMENADGDDEEVIQRVLMNVQSSSNHGNHQHQQPQRHLSHDDSAPSDNNNDNDNNTHSAAREEREAFVSIVPGISLSASIYNRLLSHQKEGVAWLLQLHMQRRGGILGDDMGLGKTIQVAAMLNALHHSQQLHSPCLIVSPLTVLRQWVAELHRWAPYMRTCVMHESSATTMSREALIASIQSTPAILLTTYTAVRQHCQLLHTARFQYIILDEGHKISNPEATVTLAVKSFPTPHRLILSGTPIQNTLKELWCLFDFVKPGLLGTMTKFVVEFEEPINASTDVRASSLALATAVECARALKERIAPYLLRRLKRNVMNHVLPQKYERVIRCPLSDEQLETYVELLTSSRVQRLLSNTLTDIQMLGKLNRDGRDAAGCLHVAGRRFQMFQGKQHGGVRLEVFRVLNELRQICNHVDIFRLRQTAMEGALDYFEEDDEYNNVGGRKKRQRGRGGGGGVSLRSNNPVNYHGSGKLQTLKKLLTAWRRDGQRVLIFSQTRMMLDIIENMCEQEGFTYIRMDGSTGSHHRQELMDRFNEDDGITAALLTTRVGGIGVNLIGANRVVLFDPDWNPVVDGQARERAWRIGQTRDVCIYRLVASGTLEEAVLRRQLAKTYVAEKVLSNPVLQRFFQQQQSLAETFYLGAEYDSRVPAGKKHVLAPQEISPLLEEEEEEEENEQEVGMDSSGAGGVKSEVEETERRGATATARRVVKQENGATVYRVRAMYTSTPELPTSSSSTTNTNTTTTTNNNNNNNNNSAAAAASKAETALLQDLVDGQEVRVSGGDVIARRLARLSAKQTMTRVMSTSRTIEDQRAEMLARASRERRE